MFLHTHILYWLQTLSQLNLGYNEIGAEGARYLSEALQKNTVSWNQHCFMFFLNHILYSLQTLLLLDLGFNEIGDKGAQYLSEALQKNTVSWNQHCFMFFLNPLRPDVAFWQHCLTKTSIYI